MAAQQFGRNELSRNIAKAGKASLIDHEIIVNRSTTDGSVTDFISSFSPLDKIVKIEIVEYRLAGIPLSGSGPDYPYYRIDLGKFSGAETASDTGDSGTHLFTDNQANHHVVYSPPRLIRYIDSTRLDRLRIRVYLPNGTIATSGTDLTGINLILRLTQDLNKSTIR